MLFASLAAGVLPAMLLAAYPVITASSAFGSIWEFIGLLAFFYVYSFGMSVICGYSTVFVFRRLRIIRWWTASLAGAAWGVLILNLVWGSSANALRVAIWAVIAGVSGLTFWAVRRYALNRRGI